jgi:molybdate transport system regulatory protein
MARLTIRIDFENGGQLGPGKVRILELVAETGSIRKAAAGMKMSYRKGWLLLQALEKTFGAAMVVTSTGGRDGGGTRLSPLGKFVVARYRALEKSAATTNAADLAALVKCAKPHRTAAKISRSIC